MRPIATEKLDEYSDFDRVDREYASPESLTRGKSNVTVKLVAKDRSAAGAIIEMRTVQASP